MDRYQDSGLPRPTGFGLGSAVERLSEHECWTLLGEARFGRLATSAIREVDIFPINFVVDRQTIVFRTAEGTKLLEMVIADAVAIEADHRDPSAQEAWSVVAKGSAEVLQTFSAIYAAEQLGIRPWVDGPKDRFVRVRVDSISGRRFRAAATR